MCATYFGLCHPQACITKTLHILHKIFVMTCLMMVRVQAETYSTHVKVTIWITINLCFVRLNTWIYTPWSSELWHRAVKSGSTANGYTGLFYSSEVVTWRFSRWSRWLFRSSQMWLSVRGWVYPDVSYSLLYVFCCGFSFSCCCASPNEILRISKVAKTATSPTSIQDVPSYNLSGDTDHSEAFCGSPQVSIQMLGKLLKLRCYHISFYFRLYSSMSG